MYVEIMFRNCAGPVQFYMQELCRFQASNLSRKPSQVLRKCHAVFCHIFLDIFKNAKKRLKLYVAPAQILVQI